MAITIELILYLIEFLSKLNCIKQLFTHIDICLQLNTLISFID